MSEVVKPEQTEQKEKKGMKRAVKITLIILAILFFLGAALTPVLVFALPKNKGGYVEETEGDFIFRYDAQALCYDVVRYIGNATEVVVPSEHKDRPVRAILPNAFDAEKRVSNKNITKITIQPGIEKVGASTFKGCSSLVNLDIPDTVLTIGNKAFEGSGLRVLNIKDAAKLVFENGALEGADFLTRLVIEGASSPLGEGTLGSVSDNITDLEVKQGVQVGLGSFDNLDSITHLYVYNYADLVVDSAALEGTNITALDIYWVDENNDTITETFMEKFSALVNLREINVDTRISAIKERAFAAFASLTKITMADGTAIDISAVPEDHSSLLKVTMLSEDGTEKVGQTLNITNDTGSVRYETITDSFTNIFNSSVITRLVLSENFQVINNTAFRAFSMLNFIDFGEDSQIYVVGDGSFGSSLSVSRQNLDVLGPEDQDSAVYEAFNYSEGQYNGRRTYNGETAYGVYTISIDFREGEEGNPDSGSIDASYKRKINIPVGERILDYLPEDKVGERIALGYTLKGYYLEDGTKIEDQVMDTTFTSTHKIHAEWVLGEHIEYTIEYYTENLNYTNEEDRYVLYDSITDMVLIKTMVKADTARVIDGFEFNPDAPKNILSATIVAYPEEEENLLRIYYIRKTFKLRFDLAYNPETSVTEPTMPEGEWSRVGALQDEQGRYIAARYQAAVANLPVPTRAGYNFIGWIETPSRNQVNDGVEYNWTEDYTLTALWEPKAEGVNYIVEFWFENVDDTNYRQEVGLTRYETAEADSLYHYVVENRTGFEFDSGRSNAGDRIKGDGTTVIKLYFNRLRYTLHFHANDEAGTTRIVIPEGQSMADATVKYGADYPLPQITREGYTLSYWSTVADGQGTIITSSIKVPAGEVVGLAQDLYAIWKANTYTVKYEKNNEKAVGEMDDSTFTFDVDENLAPVGFTLTGYTFRGWTKESVYSEDGSIMTDQAVVSNLASQGETKLYAQWTANQYTVRYSSGNELAGGSTSESHMTYDTQQALSANGFELTGHHFVGWQERRDGELVGKVYSETEEVLNLTSEPNGEVEMVAQWEKNTYTLAFDSNEGDGDMDSMEGLKYGDSVQLPEVGFSKTGYDFAGWALEGDRSHVVYEDKELISDTLTTQDKVTVTLYAVWTPYTYTAVVHRNNDAEDSETTEVILTYGSASLSNTFVRAGYELSGWSTTQGGNADITTQTDLNAWLLANKQKNDRFDLYTIWKASTNTLWTVQVYKEELREGTKQTYYKELADLTKQMHGTTADTCSFTSEQALQEWAAELTGFTYDESNGSNHTSDTIVGEGTTILKLYFKRIRATVTFNINKADGTTGKITPESVDSIEAIYGAPYLVSQDFTWLERVGYTFQGWSTDKTADNIIQSSETYLKTETAVELFAIWQADEQDYTVEYYLQNLELSEDKSTYQKLPEKGGVVSGSHTDELVTVVPEQVTGFTLISSPEEFQNIKNVAEGLVIKLYFNRNEVILTLNDGTDTETKTYHYGQQVNLEEEEEPTKDFFEFKYWEDHDDQSKMDNTFTIEESMQLDAHFEESQYTITINKNAQDAQIQSTMTLAREFVGGQIVLTYKDTADLVQAATNLVRTGYTVIGFDFVASPEAAPKYSIASQDTYEVTGQTLVVDSGEESPYASCSIELFAIWQLNKYTVKYTYQDSQVEHDESGDKEFDYNSSLTLWTNEKTSFSRTGYSFTRWKRVGHDEETYDVGQTIHVPAYDLVLTPDWVAEQFTVRYAVNKPATESSVEGAVVQDTTLTYDQAGTLAANTYKIKGYNSTKWTLAKDASRHWSTNGVRIEANVVNELYTYVEDGVVTLNATWEANTYTLVVYANYKDASDEEANVSHSIQLTYDIEFTLSKASDAAFTRAGYNLLGWATSKVAESPDYNIDAAVKNLATGEGEDLSFTLYVVWGNASGVEYTIEYYLQDVAQEDYVRQEQTDKETATTGDSVTAAHKAFPGFEFDEEKTNGEDSGVVKANGSTVLKVYYKRIIYTLHFDLNENGKTGDVNGSYSDMEGIVFEANMGSLPSITKNGYKFLGWFTATDGEDKVDDNTTFRTEWAAENPKTLYAHWQANEETQYTVYYMLQDLDGNYPQKASVPEQDTKVYTGQTDQAIDLQYIKDQFADRLVGFTFVRHEPTSLGGIEGNGDTKIYMYYSRNAYSLELATNGAERFASYDVDISNYTKAGRTSTIYSSVKYGSTITIKHTLSTGYSLDGFYYTIKGSEQKVEGQSFTMPADNITLTAKADPYQYTLTYNADPGSANQEVQTEISIKYNETLTALGNESFTRRGYILQGWAISAEAAAAKTIVAAANARVAMSVIAAANGEVSAENLSITLYAVWNAVGYNVTFDANYEGAEEQTTTKGFVFDGENKLPAALSRTGYDFLGWDLNKAAEDATYEAEKDVKDTLYQNYLDGGNSLTLYAIWKAKEYTVTFEANYVGGGQTTKTFIYDSETDNVMASALSRTGYNFLGWARRNSASSQDFEADANVHNELYNNGQDVTVYAVWKAHTFSVSYNGNKATDGGPMVASTFTFDGKNNKLRDNTYQRKGYIFLGWALESGATVQTYTNGEDTLNKLYTANEEGTNGKNVELFAVWQANTDNTYTIRYYVQDLTGPTENSLATSYTQFESEEFKDGETDAEVDAKTISKYYKNGTFEYAGYIFDEEKTGEGYKGIVNADGTLELKIYFTRAQYIVKYTLENVDDAQSVDSKQYYTGVKITLQTTAALNFTKDGYTFKDWQNGESTLKDGAQLLMPAGGLTLVGNWTENQYTFVFDNDEGIGEEAQITGMWTGEITLPEGTGFSWTGYHLDGWALASKAEKKYGKQQSVKVQDIVKEVLESPYSNAEPITIYAAYAPNGNTAYVVQHYRESLTGDYPSQLMVTERLSGTTNAPVSAAPKTEADEQFAGFTYDKGHTGEKTDGNIAPDGGLILKLYYTRNTYTITLTKSAAGITALSVKVGGMPVSPKQDTDNVYEVKYGATVAITATLAEGYDFTGWFKDNGATQNTALTYSISSMGNANISLEARATAKQFTAVLNENTGTLNGGQEETAKRVTLTYDQEDASLAEIFSKSGFDFLGYGLFTTNRGTLYKGTLTKEQVNALFREIDDQKEVQLYAIWKEHVYEITLDHNDGTDTQETVQATYNAEVSSVTPPTRDGYIFKGYYLEEDGEVLFFNADGTPAQRDGKTIYNFTKDITLKAHWEARTNIDYIVEYQLENYDGEGYESRETTMHNGVTDQEMSVHAADITGFYLTSEDEVKHSITADGQTRFVFKYSRQTINITFKDNKPEADGATLTGDAPTIEQSIKFGSETTLPTNTWKVEGYNFNGWAVRVGEAGDLSAADVEDGAKVDLVIEKAKSKDSVINAELYAIWLEGETTVIVEIYTQKLGEDQTPLSGDDNVAYTKTTQRVPANTGKPFELQNPETYCPASSELDSEKNTNLTVEEVAGDGTSVVKVYTKLKTFTATFKDGESKAAEDLTVYYGANIEKAVKNVKLTATNKGHHFETWLLLDEPLKSDATVSGAVELTVRWGANTFTITYNKVEESATKVGKASETLQTNYDATITLPAAGALFTLTGRTLTNWSYGTEYDSQAGAGTQIKVSALAEAFGVEDQNGGSMELKAVWEANKFTIKYHANSSTLSDEALTQELTYDATGALTTTLKDAESFTLGKSFTLSGWKFDEFNTSQDYAAAAVVNVNALIAAAGVTDSNNADIDLYAHWIVVSYNVTVGVEFDNGKDSVEGVSALLTKVAGSDVENVATREVAYATYNYQTKSYTINTITLTATTKEGYTFAGWFEKGQEERLDTEAAAEYILNMAEEAKEFVAKFTAAKVTLTLEALDAAGDASSWADIEEWTPNGKQATKTVTYDVAVGTLPSPTRDGYSFTGWFKDKSVSTDEIEADTIWSSTEEATYYAQWAANTYKITFTKGEDAGATGADVIVQAKYGETFRTPVETRFTKTGFTLLGFRYKPDGTLYNVASSYNVSDLAKEASKEAASAEVISLTLTAEFGVNKYTVVFEQNGGIFNGTQAEPHITVENVLYTDERTITSIVGTPTRAGFDFASFHLGETADKTYSLQDTIGGLSTRNGDTVTLTADWDRHSNYTLEVEVEGGTGNSHAYVDASGTETSKTPLSFEDSFTVRAIPEQGYHFEGWYNGEDKIESAGATYTSKMPALETNSSTYKLTAKFVINTYSVEVKVVTRINSVVQEENVAGASASVSESSPEYGAPFNLISSPVAGYRAVTWYLDDGYQQQIGLEGTYTIEDATANGATITLYAVYDAIDYMIKFDAKGGQITLAPSARNPFTAFYDTEYELTDYVSNVTRNGYAFTGWLYEGQTYKVDGNTKLKNLTTDDTATVTLEAQWESYQYTITYEAGDGEGENETQVIKYSDASVKLNDASSFSKEGWTFAGWQYNGAVIYDPASLTTSGVEFVRKVGLRAPYTSTEITLTAKWAANQIEITFTSAADDLAATLDASEWDWSKADQSSFVLKGKTAKKSFAFDSKYGELPTPKKTGYVFDGWYDDESAGTQIESTSTVKELSATTFYARWHAGEFSVTVTNYYRGLEGTEVGADVGGTASADKETYTYDKDQVTLTAKPNEGYHFVGWFKVGGFTAEYNYFDSDNGNVSKTFPIEPNDVRIVALFEVDTYNVTVKARVKGAASATTFSGVEDATSTKGGTASAGAVTYKFGELATLTATKAANYTFVGWYKDEGCTQARFDESNNVASRTFNVMKPDDGQNLTIYALFVINRVHVSVTSYYQTASATAGKLNALTIGTENGSATLATVLTSADVTSTTTGASQTEGYILYGTSENITASPEENITVTYHKTASCNSAVDVRAVSATDPDIYVLFVPNLYTVSVSVYTQAATDNSTLGTPKLGTSGGSVSGAVNTYHGQTLTLTAKANAHFEFAGWFNSSDVKSAEETNPDNKYNSDYKNTTLSIEVTGAVSVFANFSQKKYTITLYAYYTNVTGETSVDTDPVNGTVGGTVQLPDTEAGKSATYSYYANQPITITATAASGFGFTGWYSSSEFEAPASQATSVTLTGNKDLYALFTAQKYELSIATKYASAATATTLNKETEGTIGGTVEGAGNYYAGQQITLTAHPETGYKFLGWFRGDSSVSSSESYSYTTQVGGDELVAKFEQAKVKITVLTATRKATGNTIGEYVFSDTSSEDAYAGGLGSITSAVLDPVAKDTVNYEGYIYYGKSVTLGVNKKTAGFDFAGWFSEKSVTSSALNSGNSYTLTLTSDRTITAAFTQSQFTLTVLAKAKTPSSPTALNDVADAQATNGTVSGTGKFYYGYAAPITATAGTGYTFIGWYSNPDCDTALFSSDNSNKSKTYTVTESKTIYALFVANLYKVTLIVKTRNSSSDPAADDAGSGNKLQIASSLSALTSGSVQSNKAIGYVYYGTEITISAVKTNEYDFTGWFDSATCDHAATVSSGKFTVTKETELFGLFTRSVFNVTVIARYRGAKTAGTLDAAKDVTNVSVGGGVGTSSAGTDKAKSVVVPVKYGDTTTIYATAASGYIFKGFYSDQACTATQLTSANSWTSDEVTGAVTVYARFDEAAYNVSVVARGKTATATGLSELTNGVGGSVSIKTAKYTDGSNTGYFAGQQIEVVATASKGYTFDKWFTNTGCTLSAGVESGQYTVPANGATIYALFNINSYQVSIGKYYQPAADTIGDLGALTAASTSIGNATITGGAKDDSKEGSYYYYGTTITVAATAQTGYTFVGWFSNATCQTNLDKKTTYSFTINDSSSTYTAGSPFSFNIYAKWEPTLLTYAVYARGKDAATANTLGAIGDKGGTVAVKDRTDLGTTGSIYYGQTIEFTASAKSGYTFVGWYSNSDCTTAGAGKFTSVKANVTAYAYFIPTRYTLTVTVIYRSSTSAIPVTGGSVTPGTITFDPTQFTAVSPSGYFAGKDVKVTAAGQNGYTFTGWYSTWSTGTAASGQLATGASYTLSKKASNETIYALFTLNSYAVSAEAWFRSAESATAYKAAAKGTTGGKVTGTGQVSHGNSITLTATAEANYVFIGWSESSAFSSYISTAGNYTVGTNTLTIANVTAAKTVYALFAIKKVAVSIAVESRSAKDAISLNTTYDTKGGTVSFDKVFTKADNLDTTTSTSSPTSGWVLYGQAPTINKTDADDYGFLKYVLGSADYKPGTALTAASNAIKARYDQTLHTIAISNYYKDAASTTTLGAATAGTARGSASITVSGFYKGFNILNNITKTATNGTFAGFWTANTFSGAALSTYTVKGTTSETLYALFIPNKFSVKLHNVSRTAKSATELNDPDYDDTTAGSLAFTTDMLDSAGSIVTAANCKANTEYFAYDGSTVKASATAKTDSGYELVSWYSDKLSTSIGKTFTATAKVEAYALFQIKSFAIAAKVYMGTASSPTAFTVKEDTAGTSGTVTGARSYYYGFTISLQATAKSGYKFHSWTTSVPTASTAATSSATQSVSTNSAQTFYALFTTATYRVTVTGATSAGAPTSWTDTTGWTKSGSNYYRDFYKIATGSITLPKPVVTHYVFGWWEVADGTRTPAEGQELPDYASKHSYADITLANAHMFDDLQFTIAAIAPGPELTYNSSTSLGTTLTSALGKYSMINESAKKISGNSGSITSIAGNAMDGYDITGYLLAFDDTWANVVKVDGTSINVANNIATLRKMTNASKLTIYAIYKPKETTTTTKVWKLGGESVYAAANYTDVISSIDIVVTDAQSTTYTTTLASLVNLSKASISGSTITIKTYYKFAYKLTTNVKDSTNYQVDGYNTAKTTTPTAAATAGTVLNVTPYGTTTVDNIQILIGGKQVTIKFNANNTGVTVPTDQTARIGTTIKVQVASAYSVRFKKFIGFDGTSSATTATYARSGDTANGTVSIAVTKAMTLYAIVQNVKIWVDALNSSSGAIDVDTFVPAYDTLNAAITAIEGASSVAKATIIVVSATTLSAASTITKNITITSKAYSDSASTAESGLPIITISGAASLTLNSGSNAATIQGVKFKGTTTSTNGLILISGNATKTVKRVFFDTVVAENIIKLSGATGGTGKHVLTDITFKSCTTGKSGSNGSVIFATGQQTITASTIKVYGNTCNGVSMIYISSSTTATFTGTHLGTSGQTANKASTSFTAVVVVNSATVTFDGDSHVYFPDVRDFDVSGTGKVTWSGTGNIE